MSTTQHAVGRGFYFLRRFLRNPRHIGAILPSSRHLGARMVADLPLGAGDLVVEYGPGTGSLTAVIGPYVAAAGGRYLGIEREPGFTAILRQRFPALEFATADVQQVREVLAERGLPAPKAILSGLPLIQLPAMAEIVGTAAAVLRPDGHFRTFSYLQSCATPAAHRLRRLLRSSFAAYRSSRLVLRNVPPAFVLCAYGPRHRPEGVPAAATAPVPGTDGREPPLPAAPTGTAQSAARLVS